MTYWRGVSKFQAIRGGVPDNPLGKYISPECIRMFNEDIESLFDIHRIECSSFDSQRYVISRSMTCFF